MIQDSQCKKNVINKKRILNHNLFEYIKYFSKLGFNEQIAKELAYRGLNQNWNLNELKISDDFNKLKYKKHKNSIMLKKFLRWLLMIKNNYKIYKRKKELKYISMDYFEELKYKDRKGGNGKSKHNIYLGKILSNEKIKNYYLSEEDLQMHVIIHGKSGQGKTTALKSLVYNIKKKFKNINFLYLAFKDDADDLIYYIPNILILKPGENFSINIFDPGIMEPQIYVNKLVDMFISTQEIISHDEYSPQMEKVLYDILLKVVLDENNRNWDRFDFYCDQYIKKNKGNLLNLEMSVIAIQNRLRRFRTGGLKYIFNSKSIFTLNSLMNNDVILDLSSILRLGGGLRDQIFFGNMIFHTILTYNSKKPALNQLNHFTIIEEASYFGDVNTLNNYKLTTPYLDLVQHYRGKGECIISVTTNLLHPAIMGNAGVFIAFKMEGNQDIISKYLSLPKDKDFIITMLKKGECIVKVNSFAKPFIVSIVPLEYKEIRKY